MTKDTLSKTLTTSAGKYGSSALVRAAGDFAQLERPTHEEIATFKELFYTLALKSRNHENRELSTLLAQTDYTPRPIALFFAMHDIEAATPMLRYSSVLKEADLISITRKLKKIHAKIIAQRDDVSSQLASAILSVDTDDKSLLKTLLGNHHLADNPKIQAMLQSAQVVQPIVPIKLEKEEALPILQEATLIDNGPKDLSDALLNLASRGGKLGRAKASVARATAPALNPSQAQLFRASRNLNREAFAFCVEQVCGLKPELTLDALDAKDTGFIATLLVAMEMPKKQASQILLLLTPDVGRNVKVFQLVLDRLATMNKDDCILYLERMGAAFPGQTESDRFARIASKRKRNITEQTGSHTTMHTSDASQTAASFESAETAHRPRVANAR